MKHEIAIKNGDNISADPLLDKACYKDGDIVMVTNLTRNKLVWDQMLANGRKTQVQYDASQITPGVFKWPFTDTEKKRFIILCIDEELPDEQMWDYVRSIKDVNGNVIKRRSYKINIDNITYFSTATSTRKALSAQSKIDLRNNNLLLEPRYDKPILKSEIETKP